MEATRAEALLKWLLLVLGGLAALAVLPAAMPFAWMQAVNDWLGLEPLTRTPLTEYLTRSLSVVYALLGAFTIYLGLDVRRYRDLILFVGGLTALLGLGLTAVDLAAGLPPSWVWGEGPPTVLCAAAMIWLARRVRPP
jgi:uncharacterized BrkB/YihY/UPF0761 family membrane protein